MSGRLRGRKGDAGGPKDESGLPGSHREGEHLWEGTRGCEAVCPLCMGVDGEALGRSWLGLHWRDVMC